MKINKGYRRAKKLYWQRAALADKIDIFLIWASSLFRMCGEGKRNNWSVLFAQLFYTDCPCCLFYRGAFLGVILTSALVLTGHLISLFF